MPKLDPNLLFFGNLVDGSSRLDDLERFREHVDAFLLRETKHLEEEAHPVPEVESLPLFAEAFPPILHSSVIISSVILLEQEMRGYSVALLDAIASDLKFNDLSGSVLERFKTVVTKVAKLPLDTKDLTWEDVVGVFEIRNCLVHAGGSLTDFSRASTVKAFSGRHGTPDCSGDMLTIDTCTSKVTLKIASAFLEGIYDVALRAFPGHYHPRSSNHAQPGAEPDAR